MRYKGVVQKGEERGATLGFPTINIPLDEEHVGGIFVAMVFIDDKEYLAAAYVNNSRHILEAHLLDFPAQGGSASGRSDDLYGKQVEIELLEKIRDDKKFPDEASLKQAIAEDIAKVREYRKN
jgi:FAD synthase